MEHVIGPYCLPQKLGERGMDSKQIVGRFASETLTPATRAIPRG